MILTGYQRVINTYLNFYRVQRSQRKNGSAEEKEKITFKGKRA
jgi:hypothetical protein